MRNNPLSKGFWQSGADGDQLNRHALAVLSENHALHVREPLQRLIRPSDSFGNCSIWRVGPHLVLRAMPENPAIVRGLCDAWDLIRACDGIEGIPRQIHRRPAWTGFGHYWTLVDWLPGNSWDPGEASQMEALERAKDLLHQILKRSIKSFGIQFGTLPGVASRRKLASSLPQALALAARNKTLPVEIVRLSIQLEKRRMEFNNLVSRLPENGPMVLLHGDARPANFIIQPSGKLGLIDFYSCRRDHPEMDPARLHSGIPCPWVASSLVADLARTNRWGSMTRWLCEFVGFQGQISAPLKHRLEELIRLDSSDQ